MSMNIISTAFFAAIIVALALYIRRQHKKHLKQMEIKAAMKEALIQYGQSNIKLAKQVRDQNASILFLLDEMGLSIPPDSEVSIVPSEEY